MEKILTVGGLPTMAASEKKNTMAIKNRIHQPSYMLYEETPHQRLPYAANGCQWDPEGP
jgi:hypothetical protein